MKIAIYSPNNSKVGLALTEGLMAAGHKVFHRNSSAFTPDQIEKMFHLVLVEGHKRQCADIPSAYATIGIPVISIDSGYMLREENFYQVGLGKVNDLCADTDPTRREHFGVAYTAKPGRGKALGVFGQMPDDAAHGLNQIQLRSHYEEIISVMKRAYNKEITFRPHPIGEQVTPRNAEKIDTEENIEKALDKYAAFYTINSTSALPALLRGIPVFCDKESFFAEIAHTEFEPLDQLEKPDEEKVNEFFSRIFNSQYTLKDMRDPEVVEEIIMRGERGHLEAEAEESEDL